MPLPIRAPLSVLALALLGAPAAHAGDMDMPVGKTARYRVEFERTWSSESHPKDFPLLAHFSPVIGATHDSGFELFRSGGTATPGLEKLCEEGKHQPLDSEIRTAIAGGHAGALLETSDPLRSVPQTAAFEFEVDATHPMVSIAAMIAPSPDWCAVAADVLLVEDGRFVASRSAPLRAWDVGTDSAASYRALDADMQPRAPIAPSGAAYFAGDSATVGRVSFTRIR